MYLLKMVMFHSYVSLPECTPQFSEPLSMGKMMRCRTQMCTIHWKQGSTPIVSYQTHKIPSKISWNPVGSHSYIPSNPLKILWNPIKILSNPLQIPVPLNPIKLPFKSHQTPGKIPAPPLPSALPQECNLHLRKTWEAVLDNNSSVPCIGCS